MIIDSSGNHGLAVSYVVHKLNLNATVVLPEIVVPEKLELIRSLGARIVLFRTQQDERLMKAAEIQSKEDLSFIEPFNDLQIIAGQATCGLEIIQDMQDLESVFVPVGGGGLISGISCAIKMSRNNTKVIGVQPEGSASMYESHKKGELSSVLESHTIADGLAVRKPVEITFLFTKRYVDDVILVSDEEIIDAARQLLIKEHLIAEPAGAASLAGLLKSRKLTHKNELSAAIVSGWNVSKETLARITV